MGIDLIARRGQKALILVHTADLLQQWVWSVKKFLGVNPGIIQGGTQHLGTDITVGMMQTIAQVPYLPKDFLSAFGLVLVDECHRAPCASISNILHQLPAHYRYGVTATPYRADGMDFAIFAYVGRVVHTIDSNDLYESGAIIKPQIKALLTQSYAPNCSDYNALLAHITNDDDRNGLIVHEIGAQARDGHYCLALSARVEHAHVLHQRFQINYPDIPSGIVTGQTPKKDREAAIQAARDGALCVLFATKLADEGLDIQRLDRLFLTCPSRAHGKVIQQIGRITRPFTGKKDAIVYDFHDHLIGLADSQFKTRKYKAYKGYNIQFEAPDEDILCLLQN
jgi:superfamily II DNA or RNA helicase